MGGSLVVHGECEPLSRGSNASPIGRPGGRASSLIRVEKENRRNAIYAWRTRDGERWTRRPITRSLEDLDRVVEDGDRLIGLDYGTPLVASEDGAYWQPVGDVPIARGAEPP